MTGSIILDASVLIALTQPHDEHHASARNIVRQGALTGSLQAHTMTIAESAVGAAGRGHLDRLRSLYEALGIRATFQDPQEPWRLAALRATTGLRLPDCCVLDAAEQIGAALATVDRRLAEVARARGVKVTTPESQF